MTKEGNGRNNKRFPKASKREDISTMSNIKANQNVPTTDETIAMFGEDSPIFNPDDGTIKARSIKMSDTAWAEMQSCAEAIGVTRGQTTKHITGNRSRGADVIFSMLPDIIESLNTLYADETPTVDLCDKGINKETATFAHRVACLKRDADAKKKSE